MFSRHQQSLLQLQTLQSGIAREYLSNACKAYNEEMGIEHRTIVAYNFESNGAPGKLNRTIMDLAESRRINAGLPMEYWPFCVATAIYLIIRRQHFALPNCMTPFEA
jgi:hypothetical protein